MNQQITLLILIAMVGTLCAKLWTSFPEEQLKTGQEVRIKKVATLSFH